MTRPRWLSLGGEEMAEIRELPVVKMIMEWMEWERAQALELVHQAVATSENPALRAGTVLAYDHIMKSLNTPVAIADMSDDDFVDSAMRPSRRKERDAEVR